MNNKYLLAFAFLAITLSSVTAQGNRAFRSEHPANQPNRFCLLDNLTDEQQEQMAAERVKFQKEIQQERNQLGELQAKKRTIETTDPIDAKALDNVMVEINRVHSTIQKKRTRHQQTVKSFLTDDQVVAFDNFKGPNKYGRGKSQRGNNHFNGPGNRGQACQYNKQSARNGRGNRYAQGSGYEKGRGAGNGYGQGRGNGRRNGPCVMNEEMQQTMQQAHLDLMKAQQPLSNQLNELNAQFKTLTTGKNVDLKKVDQLIDKQSAVRLEMARLRSSKSLNIRSQLNDEQKLWFDNHHMRGKGNRWMN